VDGQKGEVGGRVINIRLNQRGLLASLICTLAAVCAMAADKYQGYLCCNLRTDGSWISDINYDENGKRVIAVGTPVTVLGQGRYRIRIEVEGKEQAIGNDYSRDMSLDDFAKRYVVTENPALKISSYPRKVQDAIGSGHLMLGMSREQVIMAVGYPVSSENHDLKSKFWRYWLSTFTKFTVKFDDQGRVTGLDTDPETKEKVLAE
jgi:hypothetical protein